VLVKHLITTGRRLYNLADDAEITLETNPGTVTAESLAGYRSAGVNRLSIGVQSLDDRVLTLLGRIHTAKQAIEAVSLAKTAGFDNIGIDLIHSLPGQTMDHWRQTLQTAVAFCPDHISAYGLTIEEGTPFADMMDSCEISIPGNDESAAMYEEAMSILPSSGYEHYEIANFARPGKRSRHNQVYWRRGNYLGFGSGAHSFLRKPGFGQRWSNPSGVAEYCSACPFTITTETHEHLSKQDAMGEALFLGFRLLEGVNLVGFKDEFGVSNEEAFPGVVGRHLSNGLLVYHDSRICLTGKGVLLANQLFADFV
jgi:oxygen-independent coproporphyrinogen-3 oxidase